jgi:hypothetical protein
MYVTSVAGKVGPEEYQVLLCVLLLGVCSLHYTVPAIFAHTHMCSLENIDFYELLACHGDCVQHKSKSDVVVETKLHGTPHFNGYMFANNFY